MLRIFPVLAGDRVEEILVFIQDLSESELIRTHTQELENRALLGELTAVFAHEVRNPINNISTGLQLMTMNLKPDDPNQGVDHPHAAGLRPAGRADQIGVGFRQTDRVRDGEP